MNFEQQFIDAIAATGITPPTNIKDDGEIHRFSSRGKKGDDSGWYVFYGDGIPAGTFGCWAKSLTQNWRADIGRSTTPTEDAEHRRRVEEMQRKRDQEREKRRIEAQERANTDWDAAGAVNGHPYLKSKGISGIGIKQSGNELLIPMRDANKNIASLQRILPDGTKLFLPGTVFGDGLYHAIGKLGDVLVICEGYATAVSIHEATGHATIIAFNAGNLPKVAKLMRARYPDKRIIVAADDDQWTDGNPGITAATEAARSVNGSIIKPKFKNTDNKPTDFNDLAKLETIDAVRACFSEPVPQPALEPAVPAHTGWAAPVDLFRAMSIPDIQPEWLPPIIADYAMDQADIVGTDPSLIAISCIVACASATHDGIKLQPGTHNLGWLESARLWGAIVGDPSIKKSPAVGRAVSRLKKIDMDLAKSEECARAKHATDLKIYEAQEKAYAKSVAEGGSPPFPEKPEPPAIDRAIVEDTTVESLSEILRMCSRGVLCIADELSGWFGAMDAYKQGSGGKDRANWLEIYNGGPRRIDRVGRGSFLVPNWSACMLGGIQPDTMRKVAANMPADGLLQRFMIVVGKSGRAGSDRVPDLEAQDRYRSLVDHLFSIKPSDDPIKLSPAAKQQHDEIVAFAYRMIDLDCLPAGLTSHLGKWEGLAPRLMLTYHVIDCASRGKYPEPYVSGEMAERVKNLMIHFLFRHALAFYHDILGDNSYADAVKWIGGHILAHNKETLENRELIQNFGWYKTAKEWERATVIRRLIDFSWLAPKNERDVFKDIPSQMVVNPAVHSLFKELAVLERERREAMKEALLEQKGASKK